MRRAALLAALAVAGCGGSGGAAPAPQRPGDTREATWRDPDGDGVLERGPGEPLRPRTALGRVGAAGRVLTTFGHLTDTHVRDEESPGRIPFLDRLGPPFDPVFRPHEALLPHALAAMTRSLDAQGPDAVVVTGDITDNAQRNELDQALAVLGGGRVEPDTGAPGYDGVQAADNPDPSYYRPDVDPPRRPGLLRRAQRPFAAPGLRARWLPLAGNHDLLVGGEIAPTARTSALATGSRQIVAPPEGLEVPRRGEDVDPALIDRLLAAGTIGRTETVPADPRRAQPLDAAETVRRLREASGVPGDGPRLDWAVDLGPRVRAIGIDTVRRDRLARGLVTDRAVAFLERELARAGDKWVVLFTHEPLRRTEGAGRLYRLLDAHPRTLASFAGSVHRAYVAPRRAPNGGWWEVTTTALADFPMQARMARVRETADGGALLDLWMLDAAPDPLTDTARELAFLDAQGGRPRRLAGAAADRNVTLARPRPG